MTKYVFLSWLLILFLLPQGLFSKSVTNNKFASDSLNEKNDIDQTGVEDNPALHDSYRPRHKYKSESNHQARFSRSEVDMEQDAKIPQCAVMYRNNAPVGILQPYEDSYRFLQVSGEPTLVDINPIPVKRKTIMDVLYPSKMADDYDDQESDNKVQFTDDKYPSIFAKFKIDSRMDKSLKSPEIHLKRSMHKRNSERNGLNEEKVESAMPKVKADDSEVVEEELKNILDDMGLTDDYSENKEKKREAEDENLELGTNKINLVKEERKENRDKREEQGTAVTTAIATTTNPLMKKSVSAGTNAIAAKGPVKLEEKRAAEEENIALLNSNSNAAIHEKFENVDVSTEKEAVQENERQKRQNVKDKKDLKRGADVSLHTEVTTSSLVKEAELSDYEKRVEREIREKIEKLKSEVKKEINDLKQPEANKNKKEETKRKKRQVVNTLINEESAEINPLIGAEKSENHIRRKRSPIVEEGTTNNNAENVNIVSTSGLYKNNPIKGYNKPICKVKKETDRTKDNKGDVARLKKFIGINPVLRNDNTTIFHSRTLKQLNKEVEAKPLVRIKRQSFNAITNMDSEQVEKDEDSRSKRETREETEDAYDDGDSEFNEDASYDSVKNNDQRNSNANVGAMPVQADKIDDKMVDANSLASSANGCQCDKNGNNCKCGNPKIDLTLPNIKEDDSDYLLDPINIEKKSVTQHCNCGKNDNHCKCGHLMDDVPPSPCKQEYYSEDQPNSVDKQFANDLESDSRLNTPRRLRDRKRHVPIEKNLYSSNEGNHLIEEYDNYGNDDNRFVKRDTWSRKFASNRPFKNGEYYVDLHPDIYRVASPDSREKRDSFDDLVAMYGGSPVKKHLVTIRQRSILPHSRFRRRVQSDEDRQPRQLIDMSDEDLFGALPQGYAGELARYKRVKRTMTRM